MNEINTRKQFITTVASYLSTIKTHRCGIIPYTFHKNDFYFLLSRHTSTKELGDFGGGVKKKEFALQAGLREFHEETNGIFIQHTNANDIRNKITFLDRDNMALIFIPLDKKWIDLAPDLFNSTKSLQHEVSEIVWVSQSKFTNLVLKRHEESDVLWKKIRVFLKKVHNHVKLYECLKTCERTFEN